MKSIVAALSISILLPVTAGEVITIKNPLYKWRSPMTKLYEAYRKDRIFCPNHGCWERTCRLQAEGKVSASINKELYQTIEAIHLLGKLYHMQGLSTDDQVRRSHMEKGLRQFIENELQKPAVQTVLTQEQAQLLLNEIDVYAAAHKTMLPNVIKTLNNAIERGRKKRALRLGTGIVATVAAGTALYFALSKSTNE